MRRETFRKGRRRKDKHGAFKLTPLRIARQIKKRRMKYHFGVFIIVLVGAWFFATVPVDAESPVCLKDARSCAMDRAFCVGGSCDHISYAAR